MRGAKGEAGVGGERRRGGSRGGTEGRGGGGAEGRRAWAVGAKGRSITLHHAGGCSRQSYSVRRWRQLACNEGGHPSACHAGGHPRPLACHAGGHPRPLAGHAGGHPSEAARVHMRQSCPISKRTVERAPKREVPPGTACMRARSSAAICCCASGPAGRKGALTFSRASMGVPTKPLRHSARAARASGKVGWGRRARTHEGRGAGEGRAHTRAGTDGGGRAASKGG